MKMKINWKLRFSNPIFWAHITIAVVTPIFTNYRVNWIQMTSWPVFFDLLYQAVQNPVVVVAILISVWNCIFDPTTKGISDSSGVLAASNTARVKCEVIPGEEASLTVKCEVTPSDEASL